MLSEVKVDDSMLREVNFLSEPTPCSMNDRGLLALESEAEDEEEDEEDWDREWWWGWCLVGVTEGAGTLVGR